MKKILCVILVCCLFIGSLGISAFANSGERKIGDVNGDGQINIFDIMGIRDHIFRGNQLTGEDLRAADFNHDNDINIFDIMCIRDLIFNKEPNKFILDPKLEGLICNYFQSYMWELYEELYQNEVWVERCYGNYSDFIAVSLGGIDTDIEEWQTVDVAGYLFAFNGDYQIYVYNELQMFLYDYKNSFMTIKDAYMYGVITKNEVGLIWEKYTGFLKSPESTSILHPMVEQNLYDSFRSYTDYTGKLWLEQYYGTYSGCEILFMGGNIPYDEGEVNVNIAGYEFKFGNSQPLLVHNKSSFLPIKDAYEAQWLTDEDIKLIWELYTGITQELEQKTYFIMRENDILFEVWFDKHEYTIGDDMYVLARTTNTANYNMRVWDFMSPTNGMEIDLLLNNNYDNSGRGMLWPFIGGFGFQCTGGSALFKSETTKIFSGMAPITKFFNKDIWPGEHRISARLRYRSTNEFLDTEMYFDIPIIFKAS